MATSILLLQLAFSCWQSPPQETHVVLGTKAAGALQISFRSLPTPISLIHPHTITLPPLCFRVGRTQSSLLPSPGLRRTEGQPSFLKSWNHDSSLKTTMLHSDAVHTQIREFQLSSPMLLCYPWLFFELYKP